MTSGAQISPQSVLFGTVIDSEEKIKKSTFPKNLKSEIEFCTKTQQNRDFH